MPTGWLDGSETNWLESPLSFYEVHLGSWKRPGDDPTRWLSYRDLAHQLADYCKEIGYTHVELLPVSEHPLSASWGYQTVGYYAATSRFGTPQDFMYFVNVLHRNGIGVLVDWVPAHFPRDGHGLRQFDGTALYEHADPRRGEHRDWGTQIFNYGRHEVRNYLVSNALFWMDEYHIDGIRVDAVASMLYLDYSREDGDWVPNQFGGRENLEAIAFLKEFNEQAHTQHPGVLTIAEESTAWPGVSRPTYLGGLGFSLKWNMGWMNDTRGYMQPRSDPPPLPSRRTDFQPDLRLPRKLRAADVARRSGPLQRFDAGPDARRSVAEVRQSAAFIQLYVDASGQEAAVHGQRLRPVERVELRHEPAMGLMQWHSHQGLLKCMADLNRLYRREKSLFEPDFDWHGFEWIDCHNHDDSTLAYVRRAKDPRDFLVVACNFTPVPRLGYRLGVPEQCWYEEVFNSDSTFYTGGNMGNGPGVMAEHCRATVGRRRSASIIRRWACACSNREGRREGPGPSVTRMAGSRDFLRSPCPRSTI